MQFLLRTELSNRYKLSIGQLLIVVALLATALLVSCQVETNYEDPNEPRFESQYSDVAPDDAPEPGDAIKVITWNIAFAKEVDEAIAELSEIEELQGADILLLQEMDEEGTDAIAKALNYDYVYYPASIHNRHERNFGNAVLSKWPIVDSEKLILPHQNPANNQIRIAVRAVVDMNGLEMPVYSVHTETFWLGQEGRYDQFQYLAEEVDPDNDYVIAAGDFNTLTPGSTRALEERFKAVGLDWESKGAGQTVGFGDVGLTLDHIFAKGMETISKGVAREAEASDHYPVWAELLLLESVED